MIKIHRLKHWLAIVGDLISTRLYVRIPRQFSFEEMQEHHNKLRDYLIINGPAGGLCDRGPVVFEWMAVVFGRQRMWEYWKWQSNKEDLT